MSFSAPLRRDSLHGLRTGTATARSEATVIPLPSTEAAPAQHLLVVELASADGRAWQAIGAGDTLADAVAFAQESCPADTTWQAVSWNDLYGD
jgi:hypothetical protein